VTAVGVIPARLDSTRFPRKILAPIHDKPMVAVVAEKAQKSEKLDQIIIAVDSEETMDALKPFKLNVVMTSSDHRSGTDRVSEAVTDEDAEIILNIQGDEPGLDPAILDAMVDKLNDPGANMVTVVSTKISPEDILDPNVVKVLLDENETAVSFTREASDWGSAGYFRHVGLYGFKRETLNQFTKLPPSDSEKTHKLEQLRALDNGILIRTVVTDYPHYGIDTEEDLMRFVRNG